MIFIVFCQREKPRPGSSSVQRQVICQSIDSLAAQSVAHRLIVVIGLEEGTPDVAEKAARCGAGSPGETPRDDGWK